MKIVFFGDSITEAGRNLQDKHDLGNGYVKIAAGKLRPLYPEMSFEILNCGVGGDQTAELLARVQKDVVEEHPDVVVLEVGINDVWRRFTSEEFITPEESEANYRSLVETILKTGAKLLLIEPFVLNVSDKQRFHPYLTKLNESIRSIAQEKGLTLIPLDEIFKGVTQDIDPKNFAADGVHPTHRGCRYIADLVIKELRKSL